ncbi:hypothetical protein LO772_34410 [Yinghuangia sp. ASG 101]|uniref:hypothetical protein n=1 Tax=Yinghuangia sp. ASG 101 TaxID=2896848 RepID=UPI001E4D6D68|nr:hypothetical protein [Yinghuangia sp. ASG 101]UGQ11805.1 hypothetical protein LO772_34410 [Yinghuangia sp. ASG 101]
MTAAVPAPTFDHAATRSSVPHAYALAHAAALAYKDEAAVESAARDWGFDTVRHFASPHAMPFPIEDTQAYVWASDRMIVVASRGTEPTQIRDWPAPSTPDADRPHPRAPRRSPHTRGRRGGRHASGCTREVCRARRTDTCVCGPSTD